MTEDPETQAPGAYGARADHDVVIVGGGMAGLVMARDLGKAGLDVLLLEAGDRLGGEVRRHTVAGLDLDAGAESFATRAGTIADLAAQLGLGNDVVAPDPRGAWIVEADGRAFPLPATGLLGIPGVTMAKDVIDVIGMRAALRAQMDSLLPGTVGSAERKLGPLVRRRMGSAVLDRLVTPVVRGVHSAHPDTLDIDRVAPGLRAALLSENSLSRAVLQLRSLAPAGAAVGGIRFGMARLVDELAADLATYGVEVRLGMRVQALESGAVLLENGSRVTAGRVVVALGTQDARALDGHAAPGPQAGLITLVTLVVREPALDAAPRGTGVLVAPGPSSGIRAKALTHATVKWSWLAERAEGRHVLRLSYDSPVITHSTPDVELRGIALGDASRILGVGLDEAKLDGFARVEWAAPARPADDTALPVTTVADADPLVAPDTVVRVGGAVAGRGLAGVVADARAKAAAIVAAAGA